MALVTITAAHDTEGGTGPASGSLTFTATRRRNGPAASLILPASVTAVLTGGTDTVDLATTTAGWAWKVVEAFTGQPTRILHVTVPDIGEIAYTDLPRVSRASLEPLEEADPAWWGMADSTLTGGAVVGDDLLLTRTDGGTLNAGNVRGPQGIQGVQGIQGERGIQGIQGERGPIGLTGPAGIQGERGLTGLTGPQGIQGIQGLKGDPGGLTTTTLGDVNLNTVLTPGAYMAGAGAYISTANNYPVVGTGGSLVVTQWGSAGYVLQTYYVRGETGAAPNNKPGSRGSYTRTGAPGGFWSVWTFNPTSRVDQTAGRVIYEWDYLNGREQLVYGSTGARDISAMVDATYYTMPGGVGAGYAAYVRRNGNTVHVSVRLTVVAGNVNGVAMFTLPTGFRSDVTVTGMALLEGGTASPVAGQTTALGGFRVWHAGASGVLTFNLVFTTADPWPTSLPGNAVGSIPNL